MEKLSKIRIDQEGYAPSLPQPVVLLSRGTLILKDAAGRELRRFDIPTLEPDDASGESVATVDLGLSAPGSYLLETAGEQRRITVSEQPWQKVTAALLKGLYYQRCGCALEARHAGCYARPACHTAEAVDWQNRNIKHRIIGGWHDAGDYGKYVGPGAVTVGHLLYAWKLFPSGCPDALGIPESDGQMPDILSEAKYELGWLLQMQRPDGAFYHKLTKARFAPFVMPNEDTETEYLMPVSHCATASACACLSLASRIYRPFDAVFSDQMLHSSLRAWEWLENHKEFVPFTNPEGVRTGQYGERSDADDRFWAACELFASAKEERFKAAAEELYRAGQHLTQFGWADVGGMGALCCLFELGKSAGTVLYEELKQDFLKQSENALSLSHRSLYGTAIASDRWVWGSILPIMSGAMAMILNELLTGRGDMRDAALLQWHYALGMNALDKCFVTGFGENRVQNPHHRPSGADGIEAPVPGLIVGGPNKRFPYQETRERLGEDVPPAKYYLDETPSADTNEVAIYWNSPAIFVGAYFNMLTKEK